MRRSNALNAKCRVLRELDRLLALRSLAPTGTPIQLPLPACADIGSL